MPRVWIQSRNRWIYRLQDAPAASTMTIGSLVQWDSALRLPSDRFLPHLAGRPARPAFESMRERADILVTEQPRNLGNRQAFVRKMALGEV